MKIYGLQKLTLLDYPEKTACTLFTGGCNMRCPFCHNTTLLGSLDGAEFYTEEEILSFLKKRTRLLEGVAITGGEPLIHKDLAPFLKKIKDLGFLVKLDTNGSFPDALRSLIFSGLLDYIAMDIKNSREKYFLTCGANVDVSLIDKSIKIIMKSTVDYEFRTTVVKEYHDIQDVVSVSKWISGAKRYFLQQFKDSGDILKKGCSEPEREILKKMAEKAGENVLFCGIR